MTKDRIHFKDIPKTSAFFLDYLHNFSKLAPFFPFSYALDHFRKEALSGAHLLHRQELCQILEKQNRSFGAGSRTLENLEKLRDQRLSSQWLQVSKWVCSPAPPTPSTRR